jgi:2-keto-3-deoxy-L-rhamnonate aldolase RhmA
MLTELQAIRPKPSEPLVRIFMSDVSMLLDAEFFE